MAGIWSINISYLPQRAASAYTQLCGHLETVPTGTQACVWARMRSNALGRG